jgi:hypothetical protein
VELGKEMNKPIDECKKNITVFSPTGENEDEKKQWNRKS